MGSVIITHQANHVKLVERWQKRYKQAVEAYKDARGMFERVKQYNDPVVMANAENATEQAMLGDFSQAIDDAVAL